MKDFTVEIQNRASEPLASGSPCQQGTSGSREVLDFIVGKVAALDRERMSLYLGSPGRMLEVRVPDALWETAEGLLGKSVDLLNNATLGADGLICARTAIQIKEPKRRIMPSLEDFEASFGCFKEDFADPWVQEYFRTLRGGDCHASDG